MRFKKWLFENNSLEFIRSEVWDDGKKIDFFKSPFLLLNTRVNSPNGYQIKNAKIKTVDLRSLNGTQQTVTSVGLKKPRDDSYGLPIVVKSNGIEYIQDGHHRLTQQLLNGEEKAKVRYVDLD